DGVILNGSSCDDGKSALFGQSWLPGFIIRDGKMRSLEGRRVSLGDDGNGSTCGFAGEDTGDRVFEDEASGGTDAEAAGTEQITFRARLAGGAFLTADDDPRHRDGGGSEAALGERDRGGGDDRPFFGRDASKKADRTGDLDDTLDIFHLLHQQL